MDTPLEIPVGKHRAKHQSAKARNPKKWHEDRKAQRRRALERKRERKASDPAAYRAMLLARRTARRERLGLPRRPEAMSLEERKAHATAKAQERALRVRKARVPRQPLSPEQKRRKRLNTLLLRCFGISLEEYETMLVAQNGVCAICGNPELSRSIGGSPRRLAVDHCHGTGKVRGLLCYPCNTGIGQLGDSADRLRSAVAYLERYKQD